MPQSATNARPRILILIVAYEAEAQLARVMQRIPASVWEMDTEVLVLDDSSRDRTFEVGLDAARSLGHRVTVLTNTANQGYGGNQKLGYAYAQRFGFDFVVLLHGDGQYAPECLPDMLAPLILDQADAVFGSRMLLPGAARKGGMPLYKFVGNRVLTWFQNHLLGTTLSEFHSGYRAYRVSALGQIPFQYNTNVFHFDTEIIIQLLLKGFRIVEVPIPTYYGTEICRVAGLRYAKDVVATTIASRLHRLSIFHNRRFDVDGGSNRRYSLKLGYSSSHTRALDVVPADSRVLDIGCGPGDFARELVKKGCAVDGADQFEPQAPSPFRRFIAWDGSRPFDADLRAYDVVLLLDVIEHLAEPERFLDGLREAARSLDGRPRFIVTTGNVAFCVVRLQAALGSFNYGRRGILDLTHSRLYTFQSLRTLFTQCGFRVESVVGIPAPFPLAFGPNAFARALVSLNSALIRIARGLFSYQVFLVASPLPTVGSLLDDSMAASARRAEVLRPSSESCGGDAAGVHA